MLNFLLVYSLSGTCWRHRHVLVHRFDRGSTLDLLLGRDNPPDAHNVVSGFTVMLNSLSFTYNFVKAIMAFLFPSHLRLLGGRGLQEQEDSQQQQPWPYFAWHLRQKETYSGEHLIYIGGLLYSTLAGGETPACILWHFTLFLQLK